MFSASDPYAVQAEFEISLILTMIGPAMLGYAMVLAIHKLVALLVTFFFSTSTYVEGHNTGFIHYPLSISALSAVNY
jgi:hypothetical protein